MTWTSIEFGRTLNKISKSQLKLDLVCKNSSSINNGLMKNV